MDTLYRVLFDPDFVFSALLDGVDFSGLHFLTCLVGVLLCVYVMQLWSVGLLAVDHDCAIAQGMRKASLIIIGLGMCWAMAYQPTKGWEPWPPDLLILIALDFLLGSIVVVAVRRRIALRKARKAAAEYARM